MSGEGGGGGDCTEIARISNAQCRTSTAEKLRSRNETWKTECIRSASTRYMDRVILMTATGATEIAATGLLGMQSYGREGGLQGSAAGGGRF